VRARATVPHLDIELTVDVCQAQADEMAEISETLLLAEVERRLGSKYSDLPPDRVSSAVQNAHAQFRESPIRDFVPLLVERRARAELTKSP